MRYRFATAEDAPILAKWAAENPDIPLHDAKSLIKNETTEAIIIEDDDHKMLLVLPFYCVINVAFFGFNPEAAPKERIAAMNAALAVIEKFAAEHHINAIQGFSKAHYLMAQWATKHGFEEEPRQAFIKTLPRQGAAPQPVVN